MNFVFGSETMCMSYTLLRLFNLNAHKQRRPVAVLRETHTKERSRLNPRRLRVRCAHSLYANREQCGGFPFIRNVPPTLIGGTCNQSGGPSPGLNRNKDGAGGGNHDASQSRAERSKHEAEIISAALIIP